MRPAESRRYYEMILLCRVHHRYPSPRRVMVSTFVFLGLQVSCSKWLGIVDCGGEGEIWGGEGEGVLRGQGGEYLVTVSKILTIHQSFMTA